MSVLTATQPLARDPGEIRRRHRVRILTGAVLAGALFLALGIYGLDYYTLGPAGRALSEKHALLRPSGTIGLKLGLLGTLMFLGLYLYPIRKRWPWLARQGNTKHWLDVHILLGLTAPVVIAFHSSFKFHGLAGVAFWIMVAVALSGIVGRYLYAQIPRSLDAAELSLRECQRLQAELAERLAAQQILNPRDLERLCRLPSPDQVQRMPLLVVFGAMLRLDFERPFRVAALRRRLLGWPERLTTLGGLRSSGHGELERTIRMARRQSALSKRVLFLGRAHQVFQLWHVVHRPFSYSFSVLALVHILVALLFGVM